MVQALGLFSRGNWKAQRVMDLFVKRQLLHPIASLISGQARFAGSWQAPRSCGGCDHVRLGHAVLLVRSVQGGRPGRGQPPAAPGLPGLTGVVTMTRHDGTLGSGLQPASGQQSAQFAGLCQPVAAWYLFDAVGVGSPEFVIVEPRHDVHVQMERQIVWLDVVLEYE